MNSKTWIFTRPEYAPRTVHGGLLHIDEVTLRDGNRAIAQQTPGLDGKVYTLHRVVDTNGHTLAHRFEETWNGGGYWMMHAYANVIAGNVGVRDSRFTVTQSA